MRGITPIDPLLRFWGKVSPEPNTGCWLWEAALDGKGYGVLSIPPRGRIQAHRFSYVAHVGPIAEGLELDHICRVRCCVNPDHLEPVTHLENMRRSPVLGKWSRAHITHCPHGHEYTEENTYTWGNMRHCKQCNRERNLRKYHERASKNV